MAENGTYTSEFGNVVYLGRDVDEKRAEHIILRLLKLEQQDTEVPIALIIDSYGGLFDSAVAIYDVIKTVNNPVQTICLGKAMSAAALLLAAGTKGLRYIGPSARVMIHEVRSAGSGSMSEMENTTKELRRINRLLARLLAKETAQPLDIVRERLKGGLAHYMSARQAIKFGLADYLLDQKRMYG